MASEDHQTSSVLQCNNSDATQSLSSSKSNPASFEQTQAIVNKSVSKLTSKKKMFPLVKEHFQPLYKHDSEIFLKFYNSLMNQLKMMIQEEMDMMFDSSNLQQLLTELDTIKQGNSQESETWRPSGNPDEDLAAHYQESSERELEHLEKLYAGLLVKNKWLNDHVQKTSSDIKSSMTALDSTLQGWDKAASAISKDTQDEIINITHSVSAINFLEEES